MDKWSWIRMDEASSPAGKSAIAKWACIHSTLGSSQLNMIVRFGGRWLSCSVSNSVCRCNGGLAATVTVRTVRSRRRRRRRLIVSATMVYGWCSTITGCSLHSGRTAAYL